MRICAPTPAESHTTRVTVRGLGNRSTTWIVQVRRYPPSFVAAARVMSFNPLKWPWKQSSKSRRWKRPSMAIRVADSEYGFLSGSSSEWRPLWPDVEAVCRSRHSTPPVRADVQAQSAQVDADLLPQLNLVVSALLRIKPDGPRFGRVKAFPGESVDRTDIYAFAARPT